MPNQNNESLIKASVEEFAEKYELKNIRASFVERLFLFIIAGLGLITALAWDVAFKGIFLLIFPGNNELAIVVSYAIVLTIITVVVSLVLRKHIKK